MSSFEAHAGGLELGGAGGRCGFGDVGDEVGGLVVASVGVVVGACGGCGGRVAIVNDSADVIAVVVIWPCQLACIICMRMDGVETSRRIYRSKQTVELRAARNSLQQKLDQQ